MVLFKTMIPIKNETVKNYPVYTYIVRNITKENSRTNLDIFHFDIGLRDFNMKTHVVLTHFTRLPRLVSVQKIKLKIQM